MNEVEHSNGLREGKHLPSPFGRVIALGYYDGPTQGLVELRTGTSYKFDLLGGEDLRFYILAPLPEGSLDRLAELLGPYQQPRWPTWCPLWSFPSEAVQVEVEKETDVILGGAGPVEWIIATEDFQGEIVAARHTDWFAFLGLDRQPPWATPVGAGS